MYMLSSAITLLAFTASVSADRDHANHKDLHKRATSPDNTCGSKNGFSCDPNSPNGGPCCSASGYCGSTDEYCGAGCQSAFGTCGSSGGSGSSKSSSPSASAPASSASSSPSGSSPSSGSCHSVDGAGTFSQYVSLDFSALNSLPSQLKTTTETDPSSSTAPYSREADPSLSTVSGGYLNMKVPGGQNSSPIKVAQLQTADTDMKYASVRTTAILSAVPGVCHGFFFYNQQAQEIDTEYLSDPKSTSNPGDGSTPLQLTNHGTGSVGAKTDQSPIPSDATTKTHEYRTDWLPGKVNFYVDGKQVESFTDYVPDQPGEWIWNNWSNGDKGWSVGPPAQDSTLKISKIEMYYNTTSSKC